MGRYESQRAIAARTISERRKGRKPPLRWASWFLSRLAALVLTTAAILAGAWFAPIPRPAPPAIVAAPAPIPLPGKSPKMPLLVKLELADAIAPRPLRRRSARSTSPAVGDATFPSLEEGFEVLAPLELDAISQAH